MTNNVEITQILALILKRIGVIDFSEIKDEGSIKIRKFIQKSIYILQLPKFDFDLGYSYNLYLAGPYSPKLSDDYYLISENSEKYSNIDKELKFISSAETNLKQFIEVFDNDYDLLECFSTLHFLLNYTFAYIENPEEKVKRAKNHLFAIKPEYFNKTDTLNRSLELIREYSETST